MNTYEEFGYYTLSSLIEALEKLMAEHGDLPVYFDEEGYGEGTIWNVEFKSAGGDIADEYRSLPNRITLQ